MATETETRCVIYKSEGWRVIRVEWKPRPDADYTQGYYEVVGDGCGAIAKTWDHSWAFYLVNLLVKDEKEG